LKAVHKRQAPASFLAWCAEHSDELTVEGPAAGVVWERFKGEPAYRDALWALARESGGLCVYCEQRLFDERGHEIALDRQIEHFRPKSNQTPRDPRVLEWDNLLLCCTGGTRPELARRYPDRYRAAQKNANASCGQTKGDHEPDSLSHWVESPLGLGWGSPAVELGLDGELVAHHSLAPLVQERIAQTIKTLNLNCPRLCAARLRVKAQVDEQLEWLQAFFDNAAPNLSPSERLEVARYAVASALRRDPYGFLGAFWSVRRLAFGELAEAWIVDHREDL
jgi:uncharacterized protein (TIGR02646 family)